MNRSIDDMSASELNAAIDDTNFPKVQSPTKFDECNHNPSNKTNNNESNSNEINVSNGSTATGILNRAHPTPLKMVAFRDDSIDVPGTPRTPRTSTTPGDEKIRIKKKKKIVLIFCCCKVCVRSKNDYFNE